MVDPGRADLKLQELLLREEEELAQILSAKYGATYQDLTRVSINTEALRLVPENVARDAEAALFDITGKKLKVAVRSPQHPKFLPLKEDLEKHGYQIELVMVSRKSLAAAWDRYKDLSFAVQTVTETMNLKKAFRISKILEVVLAGAFAVNASDIHIEPEQGGVRMRYRLDGVLHDIAQVDGETHGLILSRIKLLSGLKLNVHDAPQDGRFSVGLDNKDIEVRTSVIPGGYGETAVMRLLNPDTISVPFEELGMEPKLRALVEREIRNPNGMLLNTGPTGSGKTTTLYACLKKIHSSEIKIITIEDPIEYHVPGVVQTQVEKNYSWIDALRAALRQDPDVIMIGEIRDVEVAKTAIDAALTGHFVFSTLHTNAAAGTFPRLSDFGVDSKVFASAINVVMAQRLVRKLCQSCKKAVPLSAEKKTLIDRVVAGLRDATLAPKDTGTAYEPVGCASCNGTGFKGRIGIFEAVVVDDELDVLLRTAPSEREILAIQKKRDILTMAEDGVLKLLNGITSYDELTRVILLDE